MIFRVGLNSANYGLRLHLTFVLLLSLSLAIIPGCGGGGGGNGGGGGSSPTITSVTVSCTPSSITTAQTSQCSVTVSGTGGYSSAVTWSVSPSTIGSVSSAGVFTPTATGTATITTTSSQDSTKTGTATVTVTVPVAITGVSVICSPTTILQNQTSNCGATVTGTGAFSTAVSWSVTPSSIGSVSSGGVFTPSATGTATITATSTQDSTKSGNANVTVSGPPGPVTPVIVPSILIASQSTQVTVTCYVRGATSSTAVQLFDLSSGSPVLIGTMTDNGENGDQKAGDQVYTIVTNLTPLAASSMPLQVVSTDPANGTESANASVPLIQIPTYTTNTQANQAQSSVYNTAIQTRSLLNNPDWTNPALTTTLTSNLTSMYAQLVGIGNQDSGLQPSVRPAASTAAPGSGLVGVRPQGILGFLSAVEGYFQSLSSWGASSQSCNLLIGSLQNFRGTTGYPAPLSQDDPNLAAFASDLAQICNSSSACTDELGSNITADDFIYGTVYGADEWAREYMVTGPSLPTPVNGCGGGGTQQAAKIAVTSEVGQFTDLAGDGIGSMADGGSLAQDAVGEDASQGFDTITGVALDSSANPTVIIGQIGANQTVPAPTGTYNLVVGFGGSTANGTIANTPVYPNTTTNISPSAGASITVAPPYVTSLNPSSGIPGTTVTIAGTGFDADPSGDQVTFNGTEAQVANATATSIQATVPDGATSGPVSVATSSGTTTSSAVFSVTGSSGNPVPGIASLFPSTATAGASSQLLTINGAGFVLSSTVMFNGVAHPVNFVGTNRLTITLASTDLAKAGTYPVIVNNPAPGGGASAAVMFTVSSSASAGSGEWTWMGGNNTPLQSGVYGTKGVAASANVPGARQLAVSWVDASGNLWLFGGNGLDSAGNNGDLNDLWEFTPATGMWTWISGSQSVNANGVYGTQGSPSSANVPGARSDAVSWTDPTGNLWIFGGYGYDATSNSRGALNDLWEFDVTARLWTWVGGSTAEWAVGTYGTIGVASTTNMPGSRTDSIGWTDAYGNLWLFGGVVTWNSSPTFYTLNDLWEFSPATKLWTWIGGASGPSNALVGVYGNEGIPAPTNWPGGRSEASGWSDGQGNFWLFGGNGYDSTSIDSEGSLLNDLWRFSPSTGMWTWVSGSTTKNVDGVYGSQGVPSTSNIPGSRGSAVSWLGADGNFWLFGGGSNGYSYWNDLWEFAPSTETWTWVTGSNLPNAVGNYGSLGVDSPTNTPGARSAAVSWNDLNGRLWLFGGDVVQNGTGGSAAEANDLWQYQP